MKATTQENSDGKTDNYPPPTPGNHLSDRQRLHHCLSRTLTKTKEILESKPLFIQKSQKEKVEWEMD